MKISRRTEYAIRAVHHLAHHADGVATLTEIAQTTAAPRDFTAKIMQRLVKAGLVTSFRGMKGGFRLARPPARTSLYDVYVAVEGRRASEHQCAVAASTCGTGGYCALHPFWNGARRRFEELLRSARADDPPPPGAFSIPGIAQP